MVKKQNRKVARKHRKLPYILALAGLGAWLFYRMPPDKRKKLIRKSEEKTEHAFEKLIYFFIPHERNDYKPHVFRHKAVGHLLLIILLVKVGVISILFTLYPNLARFNQDVRTEMYRLVNEHRAEVGALPLKINPYLEQVATKKGSDMLANNYFSHFGLDGKKPWQWIDQGVYDFSAMGENLAMDFLTAGAVQRAFQRSPTHERNVVNTAYSEIGIAVLNGSLDGHNTNLMVVFFGDRKEAPVTVAASEAPPQVSVQQPKTNVQSLGTSTAPLPQAAAKLAQGETAQAVATTTPLLEVLGEANTSQPTVFTENFVGGAVFSQGNWLQRVIAWSDRILTAVLLALIMLLLINIFVKIRIQHASIITNAIFLILVTTAAFYFHVHNAEAIGEKVRILAQLFS